MIAYLKKTASHHFSFYSICFWIGLCALSLWRFYLAAYLPLTPDEAYYFLWSERLQGGYYDHPYMVALWIKIGVMIGHFLGYSPSTAFFIRLLAPSSAILGTILFYFTALSLFKDRFIAQLSCILLNSTVFYGLAIIIITPDIPQIFFVIVSLFALFSLLEAEERGKGRLWRLFWCFFLGAGLGLGGASKYTMSLFLPSLLGLLIFDKRKLWKKREIYTVGFWAFLPILPVFLWNKNHHWIGFLKQGSRLTEWHVSRAFSFVFELIAGQIGLMNPVIFILSFYGLWRIRKEYPIFSWLALPACCVFILHALGDRVQANWPSLLYPILVLIAAKIAKESYQYRFWSFAVGAGMIGILSLQSLGEGIALSAHYDPILRQTGGWDSLAQKIEAEMKRRNQHLLYSEDYALGSILCVQPSWHLSVMSGDKRWFYLGKKHLIRKNEVFSLSENRGTRPEEKKNIQLTRMKGERVIRAYSLIEEKDKEGVLLPFCGK